MALTLADIGWNDGFEREFEPFLAQGWQPARLIRDNKINYGALVAGGEQYEAVMSGKVYHEAETDADLPAVGDWVALEVGGEGNENVIRARLTRQTCLSRKLPGRSTEEQVMAANVDVVAVVTDAGPDFNLRRMERYFAIIGRSGAKAVVLVNKSDLFTAKENQTAAKAIRELNPEAAVHITSTEKGSSVEVLQRYLKRGVTMSMIGSSGVGKSSLINELFGDDYQWTDEVNALTGKGRHTTTARELMIHPDGGILIDNPGIREVQMWTSESTLRERFADLEKLAGSCKFGDCKHGTDAGCAIWAAVADGALDPSRLAGFLKLEQEIAALRLNRKKRQMTLERRARREVRQQDRKFHDRRQRDRDPDQDYEPRGR